jgi:Rps23 Pro-64 3,4-dihydroxylase Tpa1-like proline 4-hydroxylase
MQTILTERNWLDLNKEFLSNQPFNHIIIDDFFKPEIAEKLAEEFPKYDSDAWHAHYKNPIENKKTCNHWDKFPEITYNVFHYLCGSEFKSIVSKITGNTDVFADTGLHGGGWHAHTTSGKLNVHLDYSIHPKLKYERRFNLIIYITPEWNSLWGGGLELWTHDYENNTALELFSTVENKFNRAVLFDTTQNSWHGLPRDLACPNGIMRQSLAIYYVSEPSENASSRKKALFVPYNEQKNDEEVLKLIEKRVNESTATQVYRT